MRLDNYSTGTYNPGAALWKQLLWYFIGSPLLQSYYLPISSLKVSVLRVFGAKIGKGVRIKPGVRVKFPWRLTVGDYVWIGENAWIDNIAEVSIESHSCISQEVYLCTGNHNWNHIDFQLIPAPIYIQESAWIAARSAIGPGVTVGKGAVLTLGGVTGRSLEPMTVYAGNPANPIKKRKLDNNLIYSSVKETV
jgi:putative colanic acid biosynthesis acetyltransferase WcaF